MRSLPLLKICGLRPGDDLSFLRHPAVTHVGVVMVPASRRYVSPDEAGDLVRTAKRLRPDVTTVAVVSGGSREEIGEGARRAGVDVVQLHGGEPRDVAERLREAGFRVWRAVAFDPGDDVTSFLDTLRSHASSADAILFDAKPPSDAKPGVTGGHGRAFDWDRLAEMARAFSFDWWVAGGITPENVRDLLRRVRPVGIDVSSGVEVGGRKDVRRIDQLIQAMEAWGHESLSLS
ncbi:phosphoribosylanthranilate isomerase [Alicyclobacillus acidocaldarius]|uniref:N-(5'-phosphoribosyl)anthranilate isomerase n=1 Tax=Alicyclobacillus acidocaldarius subsp. acidocaldarius (strain ATCC 27009 / DSM 446 / BCRC 14685 / JCM 5260 / KCTC 1825 / NBRC 15652 / NCIMB 11725 / NRRL B-14509 / 104-IA) TaxID=521098 RepID=C8WX59_ALIAD|nr:phosphoribosylanthranilate isomerase [Alicyclobacillus acidocaldarius]ACV58681.1 Phosphoribosylanthranilate isomerase [Alicyclobacillus acidocaldarius subsp. acidocaldarius DSM 446]